MIFDFVETFVAYTINLSKLPSLFIYNIYYIISEDNTVIYIC